MPRHFCEHWAAQRQEEVWSVFVGRQGKVRLVYLGRPEIPHLVRIDESSAGNCLLDQKSAPDSQLVAVKDCSIMIICICEYVHCCTIIVQPDRHQY